MKQQDKYYDDGRPAPILRMKGVRDQGAILLHGDGPNHCDLYGARDVWVFQSGRRYFMHYDGAGDDGWLCCLAESYDLRHWIKKGPVLSLGAPGTLDSKSASYGTTFYENGVWHMYYLGTPNTTPPPDRVPVFPYNTLYAVSDNPDGPWKKRSNEPIIPCQHGTITESSASPGQVIKQGNQYFQFVSCSIGTWGSVAVQRTLGLARSADPAGPWEINALPILPFSEQIENSSLIFDDANGMWYLFTNHVGLVNGEEYTDAIWVFWSDDLERWNPDQKALVLDARISIHSEKVIGLPSVVRCGNQLALFYDAPSGQRVDHMRRDVCLALLELPFGFDTL